MPTAKLSDIVPASTSGEKRKFASTQVNLPKEFADKVRAFAAKIPDASLAEDGREDEPHITLKYGPHDQDPAGVQKVLADAQPITATINGVSLFPAKESSTQRGGPKYDVVKLDIDSADLQKLNKQVSGALEHTDTHPKYQPHITIAYVKPGEGKKWAGRLIPGLSGKTITFGNVKFSPADGEATEIPLKDSTSGVAAGTANGKPKADSAAPEVGDGVRRVTGSADIPLTADGKQQAKELAQTKATKPFDLVLSSPEKRAIQTAKEFGKPRILAGLDAWRRGSTESKPVEQVKGQIKMLMLNPDRRPPGKSPISGEPGESLNECAKPFLATVQAIEESVKPDERILVCTHGGNLQIADAWGKAGKPEDLTFDNKAMASTPYWSSIGKLYAFGPKGLEEVANNGKAGTVYYCEHSSTAFNQGSGDNKPAAKSPAEPSAAPAKAESAVAGKPR